MTDLSRSKLLLLSLCAALATTACNRDEAPGPAGDEPTAAETATVDPDPSGGKEPAAAANLPEVIVLYGRDELLPWLEAEGWWGEVDPAETLTVPHVIITGIHPSWSEFAKTLPVPVKKALFYRLMLPLVMHANSMVETFREGLIAARADYRQTGRVSDPQLALIRRVALLLPGMTTEKAEALTADDPGLNAMIDDLLYRVDIVPAGLALGQAAYESGYGTSRFAVEGNSLFGQWTYGGDGIKPREQRRDSKGDHRIKAFDWPFDSVRGYFINLISHRAYEDFRRLRAELRAAGQPLDSMTLADGLLRYSERGQDYVDALKGIMRVNNLTVADRAVFRDEPLRFLVSEQSPEEAAATRERIARAAESGELAEIIEHMRLD